MVKDKKFKLNQLLSKEYSIDKYETQVVLSLGVIFLIILWWKNMLFSQSHLTFIAVLVALFGGRFQDWLNRPKLQINFDKNSDRCFREADPIGDRIQEFPEVTVDARQYFRLKVTNNGYGTAKKIRIMVELYYEDKQEVERFEPNCLRWITNDKEIDIARGETTYVNLISQVTSIWPLEDDKPAPSNLFVIRFEICDFIPRGIAWDRSPNTYIIKLVVHGDNVKSKAYWFKFILDKNNIFKVGELLKLERFI